jgi:hypothetical protein
MAVVINLSDPGAVPGDSTNSRGQVSGVSDQGEFATLSGYLTADFLIPVMGSK